MMRRVAFCLCLALCSADNSPALLNAGFDDKKETKSHQGRKNGSMKHSVVVLQTMLHRPARFFRPSRDSNILGLGFPSVETLGYFQDAQYAR
jgi:hypothetical protein